MSLLGKFNKVEVNNIDRVPKDIMEELNKIYNEYTKVQVNIVEHMESISKIEDVSSEIFNTTTVVSSDMLDSIKTKYRNLKCLVLKNYINIFNEKYNLSLDSEDIKINGKSLELLYTNKHYNYREGSDKLTWNDIESIDVSVEYIINFLFESVDFKDLGVLELQESIKVLSAIYEKDSWRGEISVSKNGMVTLPKFILNPMGSGHEDPNIRVIKSLCITLKHFSEENYLPISDDMIDHKKICGWFEIGRYYTIYSSRKTMMHEKMVFDGGLIENIHYLKNTKFRIKFKNNTLANKYLEMVGIKKY